MQTSKEQYDEMFIVIRDVIAEVFVNSQTNSAIALIDFENTHGYLAFLGLFGFIQYAKTNNLDKSKIAETIRHDIGGRKDKYMLPRSYEYRNFALKIHIKSK